MSEEKSHVIVQDCIISQFGKVEAGFPIDERDVDSTTWSYLVRQEMVRSIESIVSAADADDQKPADTSTDAGQSNGSGLTSESTEGTNEDGATEADGSGATEGGSTEGTKTSEAAIIDTVKALLKGGKLQMKAIVTQTGFTEEVLLPLLTEHNGFSKNKQGLFGPI